jgi:hypothetical protein
MSMDYNKDFIVVTKSFGVTDFLALYVSKIIT